MIALVNVLKAILEELKKIATNTTPAAAPAGNSKSTASK